MTLKDYRTRHKLSQAEVSHRIGVDVTTISKYENGAILPSLPAMMLIKLMTAGAVDMEDFVNGNQRGKTTAHINQTPSHALPCARI